MLKLRMNFWSRLENLAHLTAVPGTLDGQVYFIMRGVSLQICRAPSFCNVSPDNSRAARYSLLVAITGPIGKIEFFLTIVKSF